MALGVLRAFREKGISVPEDVSIVGFDDVAEASSYSPPLTTVRQNFNEIGEECLNNVLQQIRANSATRGVVLVPAELVPRHSTAAPRGK